MALRSCSARGHAVGKLTSPALSPFSVPSPSPMGAGLEASPGIRASRRPAFPGAGEASPAAVVGS